MILYDFSVDHSSIKKEGILNIHQYLMVKNNIKKCLRLLKKYSSNHGKYVSLSNQKSSIHPNLINLHHPNEHTQGLRYYPFAVNLDRCVGICNTLNDLSNKVYVPDKTFKF